jgi:proteasome accessory factor C
MAESAIVRTERALDLIPYLVEHSGVSVQELAIKFGTTPKEISETLNILFMCGLPGYTHLELIDISTEDDVVSVIDPQNLNRPRKLSQQEIISLVLGLDNLKNYGHVASHNLLSSTREKLVKLLSKMEVLQQVEIVEGQPFAWVQEIESAIHKRVRLNINYLAIGSEEKSIRSISPRRIYGRSGFMYVEALNESGFVRHYRLDRMSSLELSELPYLQEVAEVQIEDTEVEVLIPKGALNFLESIDGLVAESEVVGDLRRVRMKVSHTSWLLRALSAIPGEVKVLAPEKLSQDFVAFSRLTLQNYR